MQRREDEDVGGVVERQEVGARAEAVDGDARRQVELARQGRKRAVHRVFAGDVEVDVESVRHQTADGTQQGALVLHRVEGGDVEQAKRRTGRWRRAGGEQGQVHPERYHDRRATVRARQRGLELAADRDASGQGRCCQDRQTVLPAGLQAVADVGQRRELAAIERHHRRHAGESAEQRHQASGRLRPVRVQHVEGAVGPQRAAQGARLRHDTGRATEVADHCAGQRVATRRVVVAQHVDEQLVLTRQPFHQPQQRRDDTLASTAVEAARHHERNAHASL